MWTLFDRAVGLCGVALLALGVAGCSIGVVSDVPAMGPGRADPHDRLVGYWVVDGEDIFAGELEADYLRKYPASSRYILVAEVEDLSTPGATPPDYRYRATLTGVHDDMDDLAVGNTFELRFRQGPGAKGMQVCAPAPMVALAGHACVYALMAGAGSRQLVYPTIEPNLSEEAMALIASELPNQPDRSAKIVLSAEFLRAHGDDFAAALSRLPLHLAQLAAKGETAAPFTLVSVNAEEAARIAKALNDEAAQMAREKAQ